VREAVGSDFPILIKMNSEDFREGGLTLDESVEIGTMLWKQGIDAIELSGGTILPGMTPPARKVTIPKNGEAYYLHAARRFKKRLDVPMMLVGGIRSFDAAENIVKDGIADYISMSRPFIREPQLIARWKAGDLRSAKCTSDNKCHEIMMRGEGVYCVVEKEIKLRGIPVK
jgi:2,4-dienoyl-CoA reductase-like NADH-dependent reductase (Old Yellow Enzyme family)